MTVYTATAFSDTRGIEKKSISGNPAGIVICPEGIPDRDTMYNMARNVNQPIVAFVSQRKENAFDIQFYFPDGEACFLCGHGTLVATYFINRHFHYRNITLHIHEHDLVIDCSIDDNNIAKAYLTAYTLHPMQAGHLPVYLDLLGLREEELADTFYSRSLNDGVLVLKDCARLRALSPDYKQLSAQIKKDHLRALMVTAASDNEQVDYEIRIFCPYVEQDEDISCGSANCYLLPYWKKTLDPNENKDELVILCPFKPAAQSFGGIELGNYYAGKEQVSIAGQIHEMN